ncbi:AFG1 family ATPase [Roseospira marina]|uniref:AFG1 family ATPase n=1 Tax=Roseospira marina TaxID=140057 RepID=A0A5M6IA98_9PROT|nr:cell division protein ZapE [Roseospira marina]KAA5604867.1 AFG1 family ATPase [Roseospira marina]MBB4315201.1 cell division protein ZapE [Roseospira marina]MBB5088201.1 cell division protein ZapE [Roseospira marina]
MTLTDGPLARYRALLEDGTLRPDTAQEHVVHRLDALAAILPAHDRNRPAGKSGPSGGGLLGRLLPGRSRRTAEIDAAMAPRGLYIHGAVGRGKSMLMDLLHSGAALERKRRVHFHALMREVHETLHAWRRAGQDGRDPLVRLADQIADAVTLLCLDEMEIRDIADAMIVARLFEHLLNRGVVVVTTSNRHPTDLYKDGLQREKFIPFIHLLEARLDVLELDAQQDYRLGRLSGQTVYHAPLNADSAAALERIFNALLDGTPEAPDTVTVQGRTVPVPRAGNGVAWFGFDDLCGRALGANDYLEIASLYEAVILDGIPALGPRDRDRARRLVLLIDALYEHRTALICSAAVPPTELYTEGEGRFEFDRTVSRLIEMQAADYLGRPHLLDRHGAGA